MGYADYDFYKTEYYGDLLTPEEFNRWNERASRWLDAETDRRLISAYPDDEYTDKQIKLCICELAEKMMETQRYLSASAISASTGTSGMVKSISAGSESITYATGETVYASVIKDERSKHGFFYATVASYLNGLEDAKGICLLYRGMEPNV